MEIAGVALKDSGRKSSEPVAVAEKPSESKIQYPTIRCDNKSGGWNLPIDLSDFKAGDKAVLVAIVNVKEKVNREMESDGKEDESGTTGELEFLKVGIRKYADGKNKLSEGDVKKALKSIAEED
jgi:hypothetical protein